MWNSGGVTQDPFGSFGNCMVYQIRKSPSAKIFPLKELPGLQENLLGKRNITGQTVHRFEIAERDEEVFSFWDGNIRLERFLGWSVNFFF